MDDSLRALERAVLLEPDDDAAACAYLAGLARATGDVPRLQPLAHGGRELHGPLLDKETARLRSLDATALADGVDRTGTGWVDAGSPRGTALFVATLRLRLLQLDHLAVEPASRFVPWAFHAALDFDREAAFEKLAGVLRQGEEQAADRIAILLAARDEPEVGHALARLLFDLPSERRPRIFRALAEGRVPLEAAARGALRVAIRREEPAVRKQAYAALRRGSRAEDLMHDRTTGPPEVRACAFEALVATAARSEAEDYLRHALADPEPAVRRAAVEQLSTSRWTRHPRAADWAMNRLVDNDRAVRHEALKLVRRLTLAARQIPRLRSIVEQAPPGIRPGLERLLEHHERRAR